MSSLLFGGKNLFNSLPRLPFCPGRFWRIGWIHPILYIVLVQFILFFKSTWCSSSYSSYRPGAIHTILQIFLVKSRQRGKEFYKFGPPSSIYDDLCLFFCIYPSSTVCNWLLRYQGSHKHLKDPARNVTVHVFWFSFVFVL